jgi:hypothetical protein
MIAQHRFRKLSHRMTLAIRKYFQNAPLFHRHAFFSEARVQLTIDLPVRLRKEICEVFGNGFTRRFSHELPCLDAAMGAASLVNLARIFLAIEPLSEGDATKVGVAPWDARSTFRVIGTKQNLCPPDTNDRWFG